VALQLQRPPKTNLSLHRRALPSLGTSGTLSFDDLTQGSGPHGHRRQHRSCLLRTGPMRRSMSITTPSRFLPPVHHSSVGPLERVQCTSGHFLSHSSRALLFVLVDDPRLERLIVTYPNRHRACA